MVETLDPFTTVVILALLNFKPEKTKLNIYNNKILFTTNASKERLYRWFMSNFYDPTAYSRSNLCNLRKPICRALQWYTESAPTVMCHAKEGLLRLLKTYRTDTDHDNAAVTLEYFLTIMEQYEYFPQLANLKEDQPRAEFLLSLRAQWKDSEIKCVETWMQLLSSCESENEASAVSTTIESYLRKKELQLKTFLTQTAV